MRAPALTLPKGGGAIRGIGEKFAANPVTGTGSMTVPIATSPGRSGFGPQVSLSYDSGAGNGPFGFGWSLSLPSITRKTDKGLPQYLDAVDSDVFILSGSEDLVPVYRQDAAGTWVARHPGYQRDPAGFWVHDPAGQLVVHEDELDGYRVCRYRPRIEGLFARIERWTRQSDGDVHWRSISKDNVLTIYGLDANSRIADPTDPDARERVFSWLISETRDDKGNGIVYEYKAEDGAGVNLSQAHQRNRGGASDPRRTANRYLKHIRYGNRVTLLDESGRRPRFLSELDESVRWPRPPGDKGPGPDWMFEVVLDYGEHRADVPRPDDDEDTKAPWTHRGDAFSSYRAGFEVRTCRLCQRVLMFHHFEGEKDVGRGCLVRSTDFEYSYEDEEARDVRKPVYSCLLAVTQSGYRRVGRGYLKRSLPRVEFEYGQPTVQDTVQDLDAGSLENLPAGLDGATHQWTDLHGEGIPGILTDQGGAWFYKRNLSPLPIPDNGTESIKARFAPVECVTVKPNVAIAGGAQFMDLAGDGQPDLVVFEGPTPGFYEHDDDEGWQPFRAFASHLNRDTRDPNLKFVDLDGDGHADVLITEDDALVWHPSLAEQGFGPARRVHQAPDDEEGPRLVFADGTQSVYLADLSGDGLTDLVRIRNGEVCYWPNLGYGRFGAKVTMDDAPRFDHPDQFDQKRIRLADIDGSGTTDIIYLHRDGVRLYFNQSGNSWSEPQVLRVFPRVNDRVSIVPTDLLGNGTACLVWSSPLPGDAGRQMRYVNLMGGQKPHLLVSTLNNLGAETRVHYAPSTKFYLRDRQDGEPWITRLPFPVHVVERVETYDHISRNRFVTRYAYHHGYFDGEEREFRGFAMVEQWDTEEFAALTADETLPAAANIDAASHVPPVHTKTWFHTGAYLDRQHISRQLEGEYYREPGLSDMEFQALLLPDTTLPPDLALEEEGEACRALKGMMLRQEVYADDAPPGSSNAMIQRAKRPYTAVEQDFTVSRLQPRASNRHGIFFAHPREAITYHYERTLLPTLGGRVVDGATGASSPNTRWLPDPRVQHALTLKVDEFGNVLKEAAIGYGRRLDAADDVLLPEDREKQRLIHITCTENSFTEPLTDTADDYRAPLPAETRTYELRKPEQEKSRSGRSDRFPFDDVLGHVEQAGDGGHDVGYEDIEFAKAQEAVVKEPDEGHKYFRRLIEHVRTYYRPDDLGLSQEDRLALLPLKKVGRMSLPGETYSLAFTPGLLARVFRRPLDMIQPTGSPAPEELIPVPGDVLPLDPSGLAAGDRGGYVDLDGNGHWWIPSGRSFYSPDADDDPAAELAYARSHFFLPHRFRDPFGSETTVSYDSDSIDPSRNHNLLVVETKDALGNVVTARTKDDEGHTESRNDYRVLQPRWVTDPNGNRTRVAFDALGLVVGTAVMGKPLPAPAEGDVLVDGDSPDAFEADLTQAQIDGFYDVEDPHDPAPDLLKNASTRIIYDLDRFQRTREAHPEDRAQWLPVYAATLERETHVSDPLPPQGLKIRISFSYTDGFGREIQKKIQGEPEKINGVVGPPRWVGSGWTIFNNKGKPVRQYEPFFSPLRERGHRFEFGVQAGVSPVLFYDPVERVVATVHPNNTYEKLVFDPWQQTTWDVNDTVLGDPRTDPDIQGYVAEYFKALPSTWQTWYRERITDTRGVHEKRSAQKTAQHANTPTIVHFDTLGRPFLTLAHNRFERDGAVVDEKYPTRVELDIEGNQRCVRDAIVQNDDMLGRIVIRYDYSIAGPEADEDEAGANRIHQASMDAGERWTLNDVAGKPLRAWDSRGHMFTTEYDELRRPVRSWVQAADPQQPERRILFERVVYGEGHPDSNPSDGGEPAALKLALRGRVFLQLDGAGAVFNSGRNPDMGEEAAYDFKGNLLGSTRRLASEYRQAVDWSAVESALSATTWDPNALQLALADLLEREAFPSHTRYDALNRAVTVITPDDSVYRPTFNEANLLDRVDVNLRGARDNNGDREWTPFVPNIDYNAKGQRTEIAYGNGAQTTYTYDQNTFRLTKLTTTRHPPERNGIAKQIFANPRIVQDLHYTYDPVGNITRIEDASLKPIFHNGMNERVCEYRYDGIYRLLEATGREHIGQSAFQFQPPNGDYRDYPFIGAAHPNDLQALRKYTERYEYDAVGNFEFMHHIANGNGWTRKYAYEADSVIERGRRSNRLTKTTLGDGLDHTERYDHDAHGNTTAMPHLPLMHWDYHDQLQATAQQVVNDGAPEITYYVYDAGGQRVRKVTETQSGTRRKERVYLGGFEIYREYNGNNTASLERDSLHVMDDQERIALVETQTIPDRTSIAKPAPVYRYQLGNHLGSASVELRDDGALISYEEYHPYGATAFEVNDSEVSRKRYRYTGKERDEESGLYYHGARYHAAWLGRWTSTDPLPVDISLSPFIYAGNSPVNKLDPTGLQEKKGLLRWIGQFRQEAAFVRIAAAIWNAVLNPMQGKPPTVRLPAQQSPHVTQPTKTMRLLSRSQHTTPAGGLPPEGWSARRPLTLPEPKTTRELVIRKEIDWVLRNEQVVRKQGLEAVRVIEEKIATTTRGARGIRVLRGSEYVLMLLWLRTQMRRERERNVVRNPTGLTTEEREDVSAALFAERNPGKSLLMKYRLYDWAGLGAEGGEVLGWNPARAIRSTVREFFEKAETKRMQQQHPEVKPYPQILPAHEGPPLRWKTKF